ncbi:hypothetical protein NDU88_012235 [Pleurodeles waltl]|uniref:Uncharacterized protein n=1 Tax=Pleurodeles waltl TaxID=8319 RepID=A0AAV7R2P0_PLEWA|nr:hypothetical protein NDU88_012235 [Pleurodeles waltl]
MVRRNCVCCLRGCAEPRLLLGQESALLLLSAVLDRLPGLLSAVLKSFPARCLSLLLLSLNALLWLSESVRASRALSGCTCAQAASRGTRPRARGKRMLLREELLPAYGTRWSDHVALENYT